MFLTVVVLPGHPPILQYFSKVLLQMNTVEGKHAIDIPVIVGIEGMSPKPISEKSRKVYISTKWKSSAFRKCMVSYTPIKQLFWLHLHMSHDFNKFWNVTWYVFPMRSYEVFKDISVNPIISAHILWRQNTL